jgi:quercetin dioxygenase-like cupin family protein
MQPNFIAASDLETVDILGSKVQFIPLATEVRERFCLLRGTMPGGAAVPLHSHDSFETFTVISGAFEAFVAEGDHPGWLPLMAGDVFNVPGGMRHAFRNRSQSPAVVLVFATAEHGDFFREAAKPIGDGGISDPTASERVAHFVRTAAQAGHWLAAPEENARIGLQMPAIA